MNFSSISKYRGQLMGIAIILIVLFHVNVWRTSPFYGLHRLGNIGVDIFFFLSGIGLWFAWTKNPSLSHFYRRRFVRIYPAWLIIATLFYLSDYLGRQKFSSSIADLLGDVLINWDFWLHDELTFWYIPATLLLYVVAPFYMMLLRRNRDYTWLTVLMMSWCVAVQWILPIHNAVGHLEIFWSRVPIFFIGINVGDLVMRKRQLAESSVWLLLTTFAATFAACLYLEQVRHGQFPLFIERMLYIPLTVSTCLLVPILLEKTPQWLLKSITWVGTLSLEIYLIHCQFVMKRIETLHWGYWSTALLTLLCTLPLAWLLHKITSLLTAKNNSGQLKK